MCATPLAPPPQRTTATFFLSGVCADRFKEYDDRKNKATSICCSSPRPGRVLNVLTFMLVVYGNEMIRAASPCAAFRAGLSASCLQRYK